MTYVLEDLNFALDLGHFGGVLLSRVVEVEGSSVVGDLVALDELDSDLFTPFFVNAELDLAEFSLAESLKQEVVAKVDLLATRMGGKVGEGGGRGDRDAGRDGVAGSGIDGCGGGRGGGVMGARGHGRVGASPSLGVAGVHAGKDVGSIWCSGGRGSSGGGGGGSGGTRSVGDVFGGGWHGGDGSMGVGLTASGELAGWMLLREGRREHGGTCAGHARIGGGSLRGIGFARTSGGGASDGRRHG